MKKFLFFLLVCSIVTVSLLQAFNGIRYYQKQDVNFVRLVLLENQDFLIPDDTPGTTMKKRLLATIGFMNSAENITKMLVLNDEPIGFITYSLIGQCPSVKHFLPINSVDVIGCPRKVLHGFIVYLFVKEKYRRHGVGEDLMQAAIEDMRRAGVVAVKCDLKVQNNAFELLCEKLSFDKMPSAAVGQPCLEYRLIVG